MQQTKRQNDSVDLENAQQGDCTWPVRFVVLISVVLAVVALVSVGFVES